MLLRTAKKLADYQKNGPAGTTRILISALKEAGINGSTLLDIGGGIGTIQIELLKAGASSAGSVDASTAYIEAAQKEAGRQGLQDRIQFRHGDLSSWPMAYSLLILLRSTVAYVATWTRRLWLAYRQAGPSSFML